MTLKEKIDNVVAPEYRDEALVLLELTTDKRREEFNHYYEREEWNTCCSVIDFAKYELVKEGKIERKVCENWGEYLFDLLD